MGTFQPRDLVCDAVRGLAPYVPGKPMSELARELGLDDVVKLASNENPLGPSPLALEAMRAALPDSWVYPDGSGHALKRALSSRFDVDPAAITLGNGSNDVLVLLAEAFLTAGVEAVHSQYSFAVYPIAIRATGAHGIEVPARPAGDPMALGHDLDAMRAAITPRTRLVFIANPNNPTGTWAPADEIEAFVAAVPAHALVVLDEAYLEYARGAGCQDGMAWLARYPNLVIVRTFSKAYGLAGLRAGYAVSHPDVADALNRVRQPFNMNSIALAGAEAALGDVAHLERSVALADSGRVRLAADLGALGIATVPSAGNFVLVEVGDDAAALNRFLLEHGVIVRPVGNYGLPRHLRVTVGLPAQNARLVALVEEWLGARA